MKLAIFDVDGTITSRSTERLFIRFLIQSGVVTTWRVVSTAIDFAVNNFSDLRYGFKKNKLYLKGLDPLMVAQVGKLCFEHWIQKFLRPSMLGEINNKRQAGYKILVLSGAVSFIIQPIADFLKTDYCIASQVEISDGKLTGRLSGFHPYGMNKKVLAEQFCRKNGFKLADAAAYGNEYADAFLLNATAEPVAVSPDKQLRAWAERKSWRIVA